MRLVFLLFQLVVLVFLTCVRPALGAQSTLVNLSPRASDRPDPRKEQWVNAVRKGKDRFREIETGWRGLVSLENLISQASGWLPRELGREPLGFQHCGPNGIIHQLLPAACDDNVLFTRVRYYFLAKEEETVEQKEKKFGFETYMNTEYNIIITGTIVGGYRYPNGGYSSLDSVLYNQWGSVILGPWRSLCQREGRPISSLGALVFQVQDDRTIKVIRQMVAYDPSIALNPLPVEPPDPNYYAFLGGGPEGLYIKSLLECNGPSLATRNDQTNKVETFKEVSSFRLVKGNPEEAGYQMYVTLHDWDTPERYE